ncbi:MAG: glucosamine-6-phosphate deaminase [Actinomycetota bacterium]
MPEPTVLVCEDYGELSRSAADLVAPRIEERPALNLLAATGNTPMGLYAELVRRHHAGTLDGSRLRVFQLDEYAGVGIEDRRSLLGWLVRSFTARLGIPEERIVRLDTGIDPDTACARFEERLRDAGGFDLSILGIGANGHLGFNEPPSDATAPTREVTLSDASIETSAGYWGGAENVPSRALTVGMRDLLASKEIVLLASGASKRGITRQALHGAVTPKVPASFLQEADRVTAVVDQAAWCPQDEPADEGDKEA